jgi:glycosyltransferase involved in cell wall biosynthesis
MVPAVSVVISTFERPDACVRAIRSVFAQTVPPQEVIVCDDGSRDDTPDRIGAIPGVGYVRIEPNRGTPAVARNAGLWRARGTWIALLDDDDEWLPDKLERQLDAIESGDIDVLSGNALSQTTGSPYLAPRSWRPQPDDLMRRNPVILSTALVRRELLLAAGGFPARRRMAGVEDYAAWLRLSAAGARFAVLGEPLAVYDDAGAARLSTSRTRNQAVVASLVWAQVVQRRRGLSAAARQTVAVGHVAAQDGISALRDRLGRPA